MAQEDRPQTGAEAVVRRLRDHGVRHVFGYPGGQITPLYDALYGERGIRHILARDEQAAAFMADGYARASGRPGVCLAVCGPGVLNAATPLATAFTDSVPVLLLSGQVPKAGLGPRTGYYHENDQLSVCSTFTKWRICVKEARSLVPELDRAFTAMLDRRPGPVLYEVPLDVLRGDYPAVELSPLPASPTPVVPRSQEVLALAKLVASWRRPLILVGGGVTTAGAETLLVQVAERLGAPVFHTFMGKSAFPSDHRLAAGLPWSRATSDLTNMEQFLSPLFTQADGLLAIGCRFTQACTGSWALKVPASLVQIDIDASEIGRHYPVSLGIEADARETLNKWLPLLPAAPRNPWTSPPRRHDAGRSLGLDLIGVLRRTLPRETIVAADVTRLSYAMLADFPVYLPRTFMHPAGYVAMGFGLPAALGAKSALPQRTVVTIAGDGCFLMSGMELATAVQEKLPIIVVLINDSSLTLIKALQQRRYDSRFIGVDLRNPDFQEFAHAFKVRSWRAESESAFESAMREALDLGEPALVEVLPRER
jgi:acetolactate synthase-1/2/3 large subunit